MPHDPEFDELLARAAELRLRSAALFVEHEGLHKERVRIFERIKRIHCQWPVIGPEPHDPPPVLADEKKSGS
jgi:hypothetical protein